MSFIQWDLKTWDVLVPEMNRQHQAIIAVMNELHDKREGSSKEELSDVVKRLVEVTTNHFTTEEAYMTAIKFPTLDVHKLMHVSLLTDLRRHQADFEAGDGRVSEAFFAFLSMWLAGHLRHIDRKYGEHARDQQLRR